MNTTQTLPLILFPLPEEGLRGFSLTSAIRSGLEPREYKAMWNESPFNAEALLDFKVWGKTPCLTCYFRDIRTGEKFCLSAFDNKRASRYTPRDNGIDFSEPRIEHGLYQIIMVKSTKGGSAWAAASLLFAPDRREEILARIAEVYIGPGM